jgi:hypothetical protein
MRSFALVVAAALTTTIAGSAARASNALNPGAFASDGALNLTSGAYTIDTRRSAGFERRVGRDRHRIAL